MAVSAAIVVFAGLFMGAMGLASCSCEAHGLFLYALEAHQETNRVRRLPTVAARRGGLSQRSGAARSGATENLPSSLLEGCA